MSSVMLIITALFTDHPTPHVVGSQEDEIGIRDNNVLVSKHND